MLSASAIGKLPSTEAWPSANEPLMKLAPPPIAWTVGLGSSIFASPDHLSPWSIFA